MTETLHHDRLNQVYTWLYQNADPDQAEDPPERYLGSLRQSLALELFAEVGEKAIRWILYEIWSGRWRPR